MNRLLLSAGVALACIAGVGIAGVGPALAKPPEYKVVGHIAGPDGGWDYANFDSVRRKVYLSKGNQVVVADADGSGPATALATAAARSHAAVPLDGDRLLVTNGGNNTATFVKASNGEILASIPTGAGPDAAIYDAKNGMAYVADHGGGDVVFIDTKAQKAVGTVMIGGALEFAALDGKGHLFVNVEDKNEIAVIDLARKSVTGRYKLAGCDGPTGLVYVPASGLLVASCDGVAAVVRASDGKSIANLKIGPGPDAVIYDPEHKLVFIPSGGDGTLAVINAENAKSVAVVQTVATLRGARTGTVDPKTGKVYLPAAKYAAATAGARPTIQPGSFELLVVGP